MTANSRKVEVVCVTCGDDFMRPAHEKWRTRCLECWIDEKASPAQRDERAQVIVEFASHINALIGICYPQTPEDERSQLMAEVWDWLLSVRRRIGDGG